VIFVIVFFLKIGSFLTICEISQNGCDDVGGDDGRMVVGEQE
jgi:hypothetical protein